MEGVLIEEAPTAADSQLVEHPIVSQLIAEVITETAACKCDDCDPCDYEAG